MADPLLALTLQERRTNLDAGDSEFDDRNREHEDSDESHEVGDEPGGKVKQVERDVEHLISGAHAEQHLENEILHLFESLVA